MRIVPVRERAVEMARRCERAHVPGPLFEVNTATRQWRKGAKKKKGRKKEVIYAASRSVIPNNLVFHAGLKVGWREWGGGG